jgi:c-di-GMP-binding flagellar brake protein YcgR
MTEERRRHPRAEVALNVSHRVGSFGELIRDETSDLSIGGMFIKTDQPLELGQEITFQLVTDREGGLIEGAAKVG